VVADAQEFRRGNPVSAERAGSGEVKRFGVGAARTAHGTGCQRWCWLLKILARMVAWGRLYVNTEASHRKQPGFGGPTALESGGEGKFVTVKCRGRGLDSRPFPIYSQSHLSVGGNGTKGAMNS